MSLDPAWRRAGVWRAGERSPSLARGEPSGFGALDDCLPGGGWPAGALTELLAARAGIGTLGLLLPVLARLGRARDRWLVFVAPPHVPYAPALAAAGVELGQVLRVHDRGARQNLWALEQALRSGAGAVVLGWPGRAGMRELRRLQLAAAAGGALGFLFREAGAAAQPSPAALRVAVDAAPEGGLALRIVKARGGAAGGRLRLAPNELAPVPAGARERVAMAAGQSGTPASMHAGASACAAALHGSGSPAVA